jgi:hypothetical protein
VSILRTGNATATPQQSTVATQPAPSHLNGSLLADSLAYRELILSTAGLSGYWRLGEPSGTVAVDESGGGYNLTYTGTPGLGTASLLASDPANTSVDFNGAGTQYAIRAGVAPTGLNANSAITVECWVNSDTAGNRAAVGLFGSGTDKGWWINLQTNAEFYISTTGSNQLQASKALGTAATHHIVGTYDGANITVYVDGIAMEHRRCLLGPAHTVTTAAALAIGRSGRSTPTMPTPAIDEVAVYNRVLTPTEILNHYTVGTTTGTDIVPTGSLTLGGQTPAANAAGTSPGGALAIAGQTPVAGAKGTSPAGALTIAGQVPVANANATAPTGAIALAGQVPSVSVRRPTRQPGPVRQSPDRQCQWIRASGRSRHCWPGTVCGCDRANRRAHACGPDTSCQCQRDVDRWGTHPGEPGAICGRKCARRCALSSRSGSVYCGHGTGRSADALRQDTDRHRIGHRANRRADHCRTGSCGAAASLPAGAITLAGQTPVANANGLAPTGAIILQGRAPVTTDEVPTGILHLAGQAPTANASGLAPTGALILAGKTPTANGTAPAGALTLGGQDTRRQCQCTDSGGRVDAGWPESVRRCHKRAYGHVGSDRHHSCS